MGVIDSESKEDRGGFSSVSRNTREFLVADEPLLGVRVNFYKIINEYLDYRVHCGVPPS